MRVVIEAERRHRLTFTFSPHIAVQVSRYREAIRFYRDVLGMGLEHQGERESELTCGPITFHVEDAPSGHTFFEFKVSDLARARDVLVEAGCTLQATSTPEGDESYLVSDPYGLKFHLFEG